MTTKTISQTAACSHYHFFNPFCPRQTSSQKVAHVFFYALGAAAIWFSYLAFRSRTYSVAPQRPPQDSPLAASPPIKETLTSRLSMTSLPIKRNLTAVAPKEDEGKKATLISARQDIDRLPQIAGASLADMQARAQSSGETVDLALIKKDWDRAKAAQITHIEIADHLHNIVQAAKKQTPGTPVQYDWAAKDQSSTSETTPRFSVTFLKKAVEADIFCAVERTCEPTGEEAIIINSAAPIKFIRWTSQRENYIRQYGYYSDHMKLETLLEILKARPAVFKD
jgi:hypothetical protein